MSNYFSILYSDLSYEKQQDLIETVSQNLLENWKSEVDREGKNWKGGSWQEKHMRVYGIDIDSWNDDGDIDRPYDWEYNLKEYSEKQAELRLVTAMKYVELEVDCE